MKTKILIFNLIILFSLFLFISKSNYSEAFCSRRYHGNDISEAELKLLDNKIVQSINDMLSENNPKILDNINIKLNNGIVSISGIVNTLRDREKTLAMIKSVKDVRGVIDYTILTPVLRLDKDIKDDIVVSFLDNPSVYAPRVEIKVLDAVVTLSGLVASPWEKEEAENVAQGIAGVVIVKNDLLINPHILLSNIDLMDTIKAIIRSDEYLFNNTITVKIHQGQVILQGVVDTSSEKMRVSTKVLALGVKDIENLLSIGEYSNGYVQKRVLHFDDLEIKKAINDTIRLDDRIDLPHFVIFVKEGIVTLEGNIKDDYQKSFLNQDILNAQGVEFVDNDLIVQGTIRNDGHIIKDVERIIQSKLNPEELDILIRCDAGDVTLEGKIANIAEGARLERIVGNISGIKKVFNHLQIKESIAFNEISSGINENRDRLGILNWDMDIGNSIFKISVDRSYKTITIRGDVKDLKQKNRAEDMLRSRSPNDFSIINEIHIVN